MNPSRRRFLRKAWAALAIAPLASQCTHESVAPILTLLHPNGGEALQPRTKVNMEWEAKNVESILIEFSINAGANWTIIAENVPASLGLYEWEVPRRNSGQCLVRLTDERNAAVQAQSAAFFSVYETVTLKLAEHPELQQVGGFKIVEVAFGSVAVLVTGTAAFQILSLNCTHAGCTVEWQGTQFECPCHFSVFSKSGCVLNGPAQLPLWQYDYQYNATQGNILIFNKFVQDNC